MKVLHIGPIHIALEQCLEHFGRLAGQMAPELSAAT